MATQPLIPESSGKVLAAICFPAEASESERLLYQANGLTSQRLWSAASEETGRFQINGIPPGDRAFVFWREECGNLNTERFSNGRFPYEICPGANDLQTINFAMNDLTRRVVADRSPAAKNKNNPVHPLEDEWFWFDPYPGPGHSSSSGEGWGFVRLAAYGKLQLEVGMSDIQRQAINDLYRLYSAQQPGDIPGRVAHWNEARSTAEPLLSAEQIKRIDQIALQRMTYRAFSTPRVVENLKLTEEQRQQIRQAIVGHSKRLSEYRRLPDNERIPKGQQSHKQVWLDVREVLSREQVARFNELRGAKPRS